MWVRSFIVVCSVALAVSPALAELTPAQAAVANQEPGPLVFDEMFYDFGEIPRSKGPSITVTATNSTAAPVKIKLMRASSVRARFEYPDDPIAPGESVEIELRVTAGVVGPFRHRIYVDTDDGHSALIILEGAVVE